jgi:hypothetical protein
LVRRLRRALDENGAFDAPSVEALGIALDRCARICKLVLDAKVEEHVLRSAERTGDFWARVVQRILADLALSAEQGQRADAVVRAAVAAEAASSGMRGGRAVGRRSGSGDREQLPGAVDALQGVWSPVLGGDVGAHHQVAYGV